MRSGYVRGIANLSVISALAGLLAACGGGMSLGNFGSSSSPVTTEPGVEPEMPATIKSQELVGKWGLASYRVDADKPRTEVAAKSACSNPYVIGAGQQGGVMMHLADQSTPQEIYLKTASDGSVYLGPQGQPGAQTDRQILSYEKGVMVTRWVDPGTAKRYGTMVFVRCGATRA